MTAAPETKSKIRRAGEEDIPLISQLADLIWRACYPGFIPNEQIEYMLARMYSAETLREEIQSGEIRYELLFIGSRPIGFASYGPAAQPVIFKLHKLYLLPDWHGRRLGSLLLQHCERELCKLGAARVILNVNKQNAKAIRAYERNGFHIADSVIVGIGGGFAMDDYIMAKELKA